MSERKANLEGKPRVPSSQFSPQDTVLRDYYEVNPPFGNVAVRSVNNVTTYEVVEPTLTEDERKKIDRLKLLLLEEVKAPLGIIYGKGNVDEYIDINTTRLIKDYKLDIPKEAQDKALYYLKRDFLGYTKIDVMMRDVRVEDISCDGVGIPIYVWHRDFESIPSNISFSSKEELASFIVRLAYKSGGQITVAQPILEGSLPEGFRTHLTLDEVSKRGSTFTIRKFREEPPTIVDLMLWGTLSPRIGAYLWICIENLKSLLIVGATASGKTTTLGALAMFMKPELKIVTIEELREIKLPHENWIPMVTRESNQEGVAELGLYDLLKSASATKTRLHHRRRNQRRGIVYSVAGNFNGARRHIHDPCRQCTDRDKEDADQTDGHSRNASSSHEHSSHDVQSQDSGQICQENDKHQ